MAEPVDYQTPLPQGRNLRCLALPDGVRVSRDIVLRSALWREAIAPPLLISILLAMFLFSAWFLFKHWQEATFFQKETRLLIVIGTPYFLYKGVRDAWQNAGIVTEVAGSIGENKRSGAKAKTYGP